jgi:hypothetical protein
VVRILPTRTPTESGSSAIIDVKLAIGLKPCQVIQQADDL